MTVGARGMTVETTPARRTDRSSRGSATPRRHRRPRRRQLRRLRAASDRPRAAPLRLVDDRRRGRASDPAPPRPASDRRLLARRSCRASRPGQLYGFAAHGPWDPDDGLRFDPTRVLLDPYGRGTAMPDGYRRQAATDPARRLGPDEERRHRPEHVRLGGRPTARQAVPRDDRLRGAPRGVHAGIRASGVALERRGTYAGFIEKIPYLVDLGVTAVELLPVFQFDAQTAPNGLTNYWGYQTVSFFAPHAAVRQPAASASAAVDEFRDLVKALHRAGIEVILDVVFNHTAEAGADGPTLRFRGLANDDYYLLDPDDRSRYVDYTGCGNTMNANGAGRPSAYPRQPALLGPRDARGRLPVRPRVRLLARRVRAADPRAADPLRHRDRSGPGRHPAHRRGLGRGRPVPGRALRGRPLGGVERPVPRRRAVVRPRRRRGWSGRVVQRFIGSPDLYGHKDPDSESSLNFVTCHDGFTLNDLVSYDTKHNDGERRGRPRRQRPEPQLERRRRRPDRRPGDRAAPGAPDPELPRRRPARRSACRCC